MSRPWFDPLDAVHFWGTVNKHDKEICERVQRDMRSTVFGSGHHAPMENLSLDIRDQVRNRVDRS